MGNRASREVDKEDLVGQMLIQPRAEPEADYLYAYGPLRAMVHLARRFGIDPAFGRGLGLLHSVAVAGAPLSGP